MKKASLFDVLKPYAWLTTGLIILGIATNGFNLIIPKIISSGVDTFTTTNAIPQTIMWQFIMVALGTFIFAYAQSIAQTYTSEKVARDLRKKVIQKISEQNYTYIQEVGAGKILTHLTSDIDNVKTFVGQALVSIISSMLLILGAAVLMLLINWKLALAVLAAIPLIFLVLAILFGRLRKYFTKSQEIIDRLNKIINESVLGSAIIRVLDSKKREIEKFTETNSKAVALGTKIVSYFALMFPTIGFIASLATLTILLLGGHFVITGTMTIGSFTAFVAYLGIIIFPIIMIGFLSGSISSASASYARIFTVLNTENKKEGGDLKKELQGDVEVKDVSVIIDEKTILKNISFKVKAGSKTAVLGPTAAGKTQLMYLLMGILFPTSGTILYDDRPVNEYDPESLHKQVALVFQDSIMFNVSLRENIAFSKTVTDTDMKKALDTAELSDFVESLPEKLETLVMERGTSLSGGQKQRIMLARALALNPKVLLLDDFTARVDTATEQKILANIARNYPGLTLISVTQKIASIEHFEQIIVIMEGEILAKGTHDELMNTSTEYVQIFDSQKSTNHYELQT